MEEEGVGPWREAAAGVLVDGRVGAPRREEGDEGEPERERERVSPRRPHRRGGAGGRRRLASAGWGRLGLAAGCFSRRESRDGWAMDGRFEIEGSPCWQRKRRGQEVEDG